MKEQEPQRSRPTDAEMIAQGVEHATNHETIIADSTARRIALQWHGGQTSALYSFGSCGAIDYEAVEPEVQSCLRDCDPSTDEGLADWAALQFLSGYLAVKGDRDAIPGWHRLTDDDMPPILYIEEPDEPAEPKPRDEQLIGTYHDELILAEELLAKTGLWKALEHVIEQCGSSLEPYINVDVEGYARDLHKDVRFQQNEDGTVTAFWKL
jgi:hypothetical protein